MRLIQPIVFAGLAALAFVSPAASAHAGAPFSAQLCTLGSAGVGQPGTLICKDVLTGATTQSISVGPTSAAAGGIGGSLVRKRDRLLVTNQAKGALLFSELGGRLRAPLSLDTGGEGTLSGALGERGAYVLTATKLRFFPFGRAGTSVSQPLLIGDGSAAEVTLTDHFAYVSEKNGSLEAFPLNRDGTLAGPGQAVGGIAAGVIVGIAGHADLVVAPIAHLKSNPAVAQISVVDGLKQAQLVPTKEVAACWTNTDEDEVCVTNPGSMTVSCGRLGVDGFESYTSAAASLDGESAFDLDMSGNFVGMQAVRNGAPMLLTYGRTGGDFLTFVSEFPVGTVQAAGAVLLPPLLR